MPLYPHQAKSTNEILSALRQHQGVLYQAGTGSGKTVTFCHIASLAKGQVWILVNREELLKSAYKTLKKNHVITAQILHPKVKSFDPNIFFKFISGLWLHLCAAIHCCGCW